MKKHTPGPWTVSDEFIFARNVRVADCCPHEDDDVRDEEVAANISLIAAAPDLLAALETALGSGRLDGETDAVVRAALRKAGGRE